MSNRKVIAVDLLFRDLSNYPSVQSIHEPAQVWDSVLQNILSDNGTTVIGTCEPGDTGSIVVITYEQEQPATTSADTFANETPEAFNDRVASVVKLAQETGIYDARDGRWTKSRGVMSGWFDKDNNHKSQFDFVGFIREDLMRRGLDADDNRRAAESEASARGI